MQDQGASIDGEPGLGYVLRPGYMLPPLMFSEEEVEALVLGSRWVAKRGDARLGAAAERALVRIAAVLPEDLRHVLDSTALLVGPGERLSVEGSEQSLIREAIRAERKLELGYRDLKGGESVRTVWPFALGYFDSLHMLVAWCELRQQFRHFRVDRILSLNIADERYPRRRQALLKEWREREGIPAPRSGC